MASLAKCFPHKQEALQIIPHHPYNKQSTVVCMFNLNLLLGEITSQTSTFQVQWQTLKNKVESD